MSESDTKIGRKVIVIKKTANKEFSMLKKYLKLIGIGGLMTTVNIMAKPEKK